MALELSAGSEILLAARVIFGGTFAFMGLNHFMDTENMAGYAEMKGVPAPSIAVLATGALLVLGGLGLVLGVFPVVAAGAIAVFLLLATPKMHDFWNVPDEQKQSEMTNFLKNAAMFGAALAFLALGGEQWAYAVNAGLF